MSRKSRSNLEQAILSRQLEVRSVAMHVSRIAVKSRGSPPTFEGGPWLEIRGGTAEPIRDIQEIVVSVNVDAREEPGPSNPPSVGAIIQLHPQVHAVVGLPPADFASAWAMATSGQLRYCWMAFTRPHRRSALVVSVSFSNEMQE